jgi:hypothetical protein
LLTFGAGKEDAVEYGLGPFGSAVCGVYLLQVHPPEKSKLYSKLWLKFGYSKLENVLKLSDTHPPGSIRA